MDSLAALDHPIFTGEPEVLTLRDIMEKYPLATISTALLQIGVDLDQLPAYFERPEEERKPILDRLRATAETLRATLEAASFPTSAFQAKCLCLSLGPDIRDVATIYAPKMDKGRLEVAVLLDLQQFAFLRLTPFEAQIYESKRPFGKDAPLHKAFPSANPDLTEAGTCLAVGRGTACVFHLMRALTITLRALAAKVGLRKEFAILNQEGTVINRIQARIRERTEKLKAKKKKSLKALAMYEGLTELSLNLELVKETYRNTSFHSRRSYKPPEAFIVSTAVGAIMNMAVKAGVAERRAKKERKSGKP